jgi:hypothetical protein
VTPVQPRRWPRAVLRHRDPALLIAEVEREDDDVLLCRGRRQRRWSWAGLLEGSAQTAGLFAALRVPSLTNRAVVAAFRGVSIHARSHGGAVLFRAFSHRRVFHFHRVLVEARDPDGALLLDAEIIVAPPAPPPGSSEGRSRR